MEYKAFFKITFLLTILFAILVIVYNALTTPSLVAPEVEIIETDITTTQTPEPDKVPDIEWSDGQTTDNSEYTPPAPIDPEMWWDINEVTKEQLCEIPGVGDKTAQKILDYRETLTQYYDISELTEIKGIGDKTLQKLKQYLYVKD